jgi:hypothetical protein
MAMGRRNIFLLLLLLLPPLLVEYDLFKASYIDLIGKF